MVAIVDAGSAVSEINTGIRWEEGRLERVVGRRVEGSVHLLPFGRNQHTSAPDIEVGVDLDLHDGVEDHELLKPAISAEHALCVHLEFHVLVYLAIEIDARIVQIEIVGPVRAVRRGILHRGIGTPCAHAQADPLGVVHRNFCTRICL